MTEKGEPMLLAGELTDDEIPDPITEECRGGELLIDRRCCGEFMEELSGLLESLLLSHIPSSASSKTAETIAAGGAGWQRGTKTRCLPASEV